VYNILTKPDNSQFKFTCFSVRQVSQHASRFESNSQRLIVLT